MKVKVTIRFRGREVTYPELALEDLREIAEDLRDVSVVEVAPSMEGRAMTLVLAPSKGAGKKVEKPAAKEAPAPTAAPAAEEKAESPKVESANPE
jgi:translation initiation factor IF-3